VIASPYLKPAHFSDPFMDWGGCEERLTTILAKPPETLVWEDYQVIFYQHLPAADYEEGCYYVPYYLEYLSQASDLEDRTYEGFFWYIDYFAVRFEQDGLLSQILEQIWECFLRLTKSFKVVRLTDDELERHGISPAYREIAYLTQTVTGILDQFIEWPVYSSYVTRLKEHFDRPHSVEHAHWYSELAFHARNWLWLEQEPLKAFQEIFDFFHRLDRYRAFHQAVLFSPITEGFFEYNSRIAPN